jgi:membrane associated rhomboid family serine protease
MKQSLLETVISLLQGASWALAVIGMVVFYNLFSPFGFIVGIFSAFFGSLAGLFFVVFFEIALLQIQKYKETKEQTLLLRKIYEKLSDN